MPKQKKSELGEVRIFAVLAAEVIGRYIHTHADERDETTGFHLTHINGIEKRAEGPVGLQVTTRVACSSLPKLMTVILTFKSVGALSCWVHVEAYFPGDQPAIQGPRIWKGRIEREADGSLALKRLDYLH